MTARLPRLPYSGRPAVLFLPAAFQIRANFNKVGLPGLFLNILTYVLHSSVDAQMQ